MSARATSRSVGFHTGFVRAALLLCSVLWLGAAECGNAPPGQAASDPQSVQGELVEPPFAVRGEAEGLLLVWFDEEGPHTASSRAEIPEAHRDRVRVDSLTLAPDQRLDPEDVYVADLTRAGKDGAYPVRKLSRATFEAWIDAAGDRNQKGGTGGKGVVLYSASWCGACRAAAKYLREQDVSFVEKDIEKDKAAYEEMQRKAQAAGVSPSGVPVIDFQGQLLLGFDRARLDQLIAKSTKRPAAPEPSSTQDLGGTTI